MISSSVRSLHKLQVMNKPDCKSYKILSVYVDQSSNHQNREMFPHQSNYKIERCVIEIIWIVIIPIVHINTDFINMYGSIMQGCVSDACRERSYRPP